MKSAAVAVLSVLCAALSFGRETGAISQPVPPGPWVSLGPSGGDIRGLVRNPKSEAEMYAVSASLPSQIFRSVTSGKTWTLAGLAHDFIIDLAHDPVKASTIYLLGSSGRLYKSSDAGKTYTKFSFPSSFSAYYGRIAVHPGNPNIIVVMGNSGGSLAVLKTEDGGADWTLTALLPANRYAYGWDIAFAPGNPKYIYCCGYGLTASYVNKPMVFVSKNGGASWTNIANPAVFDSGRCLSIHVDAKDARKAWIGHTGGVARTINAGSSWISQKTRDIAEIKALAGDLSSPSILYAAGLGAGSVATCFKSSDGGKTWKANTSGLYGEGRRLLADGARVFLSTGTGIYQSLNGGVSWKASHSGIRGAHIQAMAVAPSSPSTLYAGIPGFPLIKTANTGGAWTICGKFEGNALVNNVVVHPSSPQTILVKPSG